MVLFCSHMSRDRPDFTGLLRKIIIGQDTIFEPLDLHVSQVGGSLISISNGERTLNSFGLPFSSSRNDACRDGKQGTTNLEEGSGAGKAELDSCYSSATNPNSESRLGSTLHIVLISYGNEFQPLSLLSLLSAAGWYVFTNRNGDGVGWEQQEPG